MDIFRYLQNTCRDNKRNDGADTQDTSRVTKSRLYFTGFFFR